MERRKNIMRISRRLLYYSGAALLATSLLFWGALDLDGNGDCLVLVTAIVFGCGIIGGFVSIQQRLQKIGDEELELLSTSWASVLIIPLFGGIFALVLYVVFLTEILDVNLFPEFRVPVFTGNRTTDLMEFIRETYPKTGQDMAKLMFWSFVAGFSERFVPQVIQSVSSQAGAGDAHPAAARPGEPEPDEEAPEGGSGQTDGTADGTPQEAEESGGEIGEEGAEASGGRA